eukprot:COSAG02_NODE_827_length_16704_cov_8.649322_1_plen_43_part_00
MQKQRADTRRGGGSLRAHGGGGGGGEGAVGAGAIAPIQEGAI